MKNKRLTKIAILSFLSASLLAGCNKSNTQKQVETIPTEAITEEMTTQEEIVVSNETIDRIVLEYNYKTSKNIKLSDLLIEEFDNPKYIWNTEGENYIYDYKINGTDNPGYTYIDPGYHGKMYAVILKNDDNYEPIAALANIDNKVVNVKVTYLYENNEYEPSDNYIIIDNPTKEDFDNIKNGKEYIQLDNNKKLSLTKNN